MKNPIIDMEEKIKRAFESELGQQCDCLFSTSDERIFIRYNEAVQHSQGMLDPNTKPLSDETILIWFEEYSGQDPNPTYVNDIYYYPNDQNN